LAGLPGEVIARAKEILADLEKEQIGTGQQSFGFGESVRTDFQSGESSLRSHRGLEELKNLDLNTLTPLEALNKLHQLKILSNE
jgi:DNA mismatch repair protein MutS